MEDRKVEQKVDTKQNSLEDIENHKTVEDKQLYQFNEENLDNVRTALQDLNLNIARLQSEGTLGPGLREKFE